MADQELSRLAGRLDGEVFVPTSEGYDEARSIFNSMIERRPGVIAQCETVDDVAAAIAFGRAQDLELAVRGGGHSVAGMSLCDGGLVIDLRRMHAARVDEASRTVTVGGGATMADLDRATEPFGLAVTGGRVSTTGVGGFTLGGGSGWLDRKFGLACEHLTAVELVTADGEVLHVSEDHHAELFWALHGGGGNFGVATELTFRLFPLPVVTAALLFWSADRGQEVLRAYRDFIDTAPDEVGGGFFFITGPEEDFVPEHLHGRLTCLVLIVYAGGEEAARSVLAPMLTLGAEGQLLAEMPYAELQCMLDDPPGYRNYWSAEHLHSLPDQAVDVFCARAADMIVPSPSQHVLFPLGGAASRSTGGYPIPWLNAPWVAHPFALWEDPADDERGRQWARSVRAEMQPWSTGAVYLNFIGDEGEDRVRAGFGDGHYDRLAAVKAAYDPDNVFHLNHNIKPA